MQRSKLLIVGIAVIGAGGLALALRSSGSSGSHADATHSAPSASSSTAHAARVPASSQLAASVAKARALAEPEARRDGLIHALAESAEREPSSAARLAAQLSTAEGRDDALREAVGHYLSAEPVQARAWLNELVAREDAELNFVLAQAAARHDPKLGLELARRVHENLRAPLLQELFADWAGSEPLAASATAATLENPRDQRAAAAGVTSTWAQSDPQAAWVWATAIPSEGVRRPALERLVGAWSEHDPSAAARAAIGAQSSSRQRLIDTAVSAWALRDSDEALTWLQTVPDAEARDGAATAALLQLIQTKPTEAAERAAAWAQREASEASRSVLEKVLSAFRAQDAHAAAEWQRSHRVR